MTGLDPASGPRDAAELLRRWPGSGGVALTLTLAMGVSGYASAGATAGLFLGGLAIATLIAPPLAMAHGRWLERAFVIDAIVSTLAIIWLVAVIQSPAGVLQWLGACVVLATYTIAVVGLASALVRVRLGRVIAAGIAVVIGIAYLSWPIWLAPYLTGPGRERLVAALVWAHPLFAMDGLLIDAFGVPWAQHRIAYLLTNIGDDISYELPRSILPCALVHLAIGAALIGLSWRRPRAGITAAEALP